jgi:predicted ABC-type ATPase
MGANPVLHLVVGPNGSGKSTLFDLVIGPVTNLPFVNADVLARERWPGHEMEHAYDASKDAARRRSALISDRTSFATETVFSHPSKVDLIHQAVAAGYLVTLHVVVVPVELSVARVRQRASLGGHDVPEHKVRERFERLWHNVVEAIPLAEEAVIYDNSRAANPFVVLARFRAGTAMRPADWPAWTPTELRSL